MPDLLSFVERIHYENRREYTDIQGNVAYLDSRALERPFDMPMAQRIIAGVILVVALVIGLIMINNLVISRWTESASSEQAVSDNLAREASIQTIPDVAVLINLDNEAIKDTFSQAGFRFYDASEANDSTNLVLYKLPSDVSVDDAAVMYAKGLGSLNAEQASRLLNGSWSFTADRVSGTSMVVRYADFSTGDPQIAVQSALTKEGFDLSSLVESGEDDSGNTYSSGTLDANGTPCTWKVSALPLDEMYSIAGLPKEACYVGVRVTVA